MRLKLCEICHLPEKYKGDISKCPGCGKQVCENCFEGEKCCKETEPKHLSENKFLRE